MLLFVFLLGICVKGYSQATPPTDFFAGKWEILVTGLPDGDTKFVTDLVRKDGKLTGELKDPTGKKTEATPISKVEEEPGKKITLYMSTTQAGEVPIELIKADEDHLKGQLMGMFDATAVRLK